MRPKGDMLPADGEPGGVHDVRASDVLPQLAMLLPRRKTSNETCDNELCRLFDRELEPTALLLPPLPSPKCMSSACSFGWLTVAPPRSSAISSSSMDPRWPGKRREGDRGTAAAAAAAAALGLGGVSAVKAPLRACRPVTRLATCTALGADSTGKKDQGTRCAKI